MPALFEARGVTKRFGGLTALHGVDFAVDRGISSIIGPNGAGKTTLFNIFTGLYAADEGSVTFRDQPLLGLRPDQITALGICRTFQNIRLFANMTAIENVLVGMNSRISLRLWDVLSRSPGFRRTESELAARASRAARLASGCRPARTSSRATCRTAIGDGSSSPGRSPPSPRCCCSTSRPPG